ncbi:F0F1 ATP synthase subunit A [Candidatus Dependentiae bacterium]|nr:F0F1 ATP synthase subunit A [Candidatus Dependentiae bacterium]
MNNFDLLATHYWYPLYPHLAHSHFRLNSETIINTWIMLGIGFLLLLPVRRLLRKKDGIARYLAISFVSSFVDLTKQTLGTLHRRHFYFITALFCFIFLCNLASIIPWVEEPTSDLNTTLALGIISFMYIQYYAIKKNGVKEYLKSYLSPFFIMLPLNIIGKLASIGSMSFRLFGNIFGGSIISKIWTKVISGSVLWESVGILSGMNLLITGFFGLFEGFLQAFVFAMLTVTYLSIAIQDEGEDEEVYEGATL